jgi:hypothetical protein
MEMEISSQGFNLPLTRCASRSFCARFLPIAFLSNNCVKEENSEKILQAL